MKSLYNHLLEASLSSNNLNESSILGDIEDTLLTGDVEVPRALILEYLEENYRGKWTISEKPDKDGLYEVSSDSDCVHVKNTKITSLTNGLFIWTSVRGDFYCYNCNSLKNLEGAPKVIEGNFYCFNCKSLESLEGAPKIVKGNFDCNYCKSLKSLEGSPETVKGYFDCSKCSSLKNLKGAPKKVGGNFYCQACGFTKDDVNKVSKVKGKIFC